jgi:cytochrome c peroxidase
MIRVYRMARAGALTSVCWLYTSDKLMLAAGFMPPKDAPAMLEVLRLSVGTDPGLALKTRKGTGYCKVPSLKGVCYRGHYLHDGSVGSLEEMFDSGRVTDTHKPGGCILVGETTHAIAATNLDYSSTRQSASN